MTDKLREQVPSVPENWLYYDTDETSRVFTKYVSLGKDAEPWAECTEAEKQAWEAEHNPEPEPQVEDAEVVNQINGDETNDGVA